MGKHEKKAGRGRPTLGDEPRDAIFRFRVTQREKDEILAKGGSEWLRRRLWPRKRNGKL